LARTKPEFAELDRAIRGWLGQPGLEPQGHLNQRQLAVLLRSSLVWAAPSFRTSQNIPFTETSCIGALEAQAAGCHVVASAIGALPETVKIGTLVMGPVGSDEWLDRLVNALVEGLTDPRVQSRAQRLGQPAISDHGWPPVAAAIANFIEMPRARP
jgi:glycosyltransferase involved in cell wall biosynthesis